MLLILFGCTKIKFKTFNTEQGWLTIQYPSIWTQSEEDEGTYLFKNDKSWKGSFRITPLKVSGKNKDSLDFNIDNYLKDEIKKNKGSKMIKIGPYNTVNYYDTATEDGQNLTLQYWIFGQGNTIIIATYTTLTDKINNSDIRKEIDYCKQTISRLKIK